MEDSSEEEEFLRLRLSVAAARSSESRKNKGMNKKRENNSKSGNCVMMMRSSSPPAASSSLYEGKILRLLQMREMMLRQDTSKSNKRREQKGEEEKGLPLIHLLLTTATAVDERNLGAAIENLTQVYQTVSLKGDSVERVVAYFADGLAARLLTRKSPFYSMLMEEATEEEQFLAFTELYRVSPYYQFAHFTANQAILEAFEREEHSNNRALHVIDFDVSYGFQWPSLIQSLSDKATAANRISLRITGFGASLKDLQDTEARLVSFSKGFTNLVFEFQGLLRSATCTCNNHHYHSRIINLRKKKKNETVAVNLVSYLNARSSSFMKLSDTLGFVHSLSPSIVVLVKQEGSRSIRTFLSRFTESLHYFAAMFDSLDDCLPLESAERLRIEKKLLGKEIKGVMNCDMDMDGGDCPRYERMETHGFVGTKMSSKSLIQAKLLLKMRTHYCPMQFEEQLSNGGGFRISERDDGRAISLAWQNRFLLTVSAWQPLSL